MKYHPIEIKIIKRIEKFKEISNAYNVLSNKQKRQIYDQFGEEGLQGSSGPNELHFLCLKKCLLMEVSLVWVECPVCMECWGFSFNMNNMSRGSQSNSTQEVKKIKISLEDLYKGKNITLKLLELY